MRRIIILGFGLGCATAAIACDDSGSTVTPPASTGSTTGATAGGTTGGATGATTGGAPVVGDPIPFAAGWADFAGNSYGIQGAFYTFSDAVDMGASSIAPDTGAVDFAMYGDQVCAQGTAGQVQMELFSQYWGAAIGFNLSQEAGVDAALPYDASLHNVAGFSFNVGGTNPFPAGGELRFDLKVNGDGANYCAKITAPGGNTFMLTDLKQSCWDAAMAATAPTPDPTKLEALHWQYVTNTAASYDFHLCISDLRVVPGS